MLRASAFPVRTHTSGPIVYAHRGASFELPENTHESFALALSLGADALETDAHLTRDGRVVLSHDSTGNRMAGVPTPIRDASFAEVSAWDVGARFTPRGPHDGRGASLRPYRMPLFAEILEAFPDTVFNVDAKEHVRDMVPALLRVVRRANAAHRVRIASFSAKVLRRVRKLGYEGETGSAPIDLLRAMLGLSVPGHAAQVPLKAYGVTFGSQKSIDRLHRQGLHVDFWTIDDPDVAARLVGMGADGIMTDDVRRIASHRSSWNSGSRLRT